MKTVRGTVYGIGLAALFAACALRAAAQPTDIISHLFKPTTYVAWLSAEWGRDEPVGARGTGIGFYMLGAPFNLFRESVYIETRDTMPDSCLCKRKQDSACLPRCRRDTTYSIGISLGLGYETHFSVASPNAMLDSRSDIEGISSVIRFSWAALRNKSGIPTVSPFIAISGVVLGERTLVGTYAGPDDGMLTNGSLVKSVMPGIVTTELHAGMNIRLFENVEIGVELSHHNILFHHVVHEAVNPALAPAAELLQKKLGSELDYSRNAVRVSLLGTFQ